MTRFPYDQFAKDYFQELLSPLGTVETSKDVAGEVLEIDVYFVPNAQSEIEPEILGLLGKFALKPALFEPFRNPVTISEVYSCTIKLLNIYASFEREAKRNRTKLDRSSLPKLWIISPTASKNLLTGFGAKLDESNWGKGVYQFDKHWRGAVVVIHQLPATPETLWLRLLGRGGVQKRAIEEVKALDINNPLRSKAVNLLANLKTTLELNQNLDVEDRNLVMQLSPIYEQRLAEAEQKGKQEGEINGCRTVIENLLRVRFGTLDEQLSTIIEPILALSPEEFTPLLVQLSREDLLRRFSQQ